ncbi:MAG: S-methyl-5-thioribose-1-phosphate isomerase, partial [Planctomycetaceae bacterium]
MSESIQPVKIVPPAKVVQWVGDETTGYLRLLDQTLLPNEVVYIDCRTKQDVWLAIKRLAVRGAPAIGVAAGYGMVVATQAVPDGDDFMDAVEDAAQYLESSRPTAVNLSWAARRILGRAQLE